MLAPPPDGNTRAQCIANVEGALPHRASSSKLPTIAPMKKTALGARPYVYMTSALCVDSWLCGCAEGLVRYLRCFRDRYSRGRAGSRRLHSAKREEAYTHKFTRKNQV